MREILILAIHLLVTLARFLRPGGVRAVAAESLLLKQQLLISSRSRQRAPNLTSVDRFVLGLATLFVRPHRLPKLGALVRPATLLKFHEALVRRKYSRLFSSSPSPRRKPGPKGPSAELVAAIIELKRRNPHFGCVRIAQQITRAFAVEIDKDVVRRVLAKHHGPGDSGTPGPSWLTFIAQMFNQAVTGPPPPKHVSTDHDPLFRFYRWLANLRVREIEEVKSVPYVPVSHPFVERLIGTIRREYWTASSSGTPSIWHESWRHSGTTTTAIACIARSPVSRQRSAPAHCVPLLLHWITTGGSGTAGACSSSPSLLDYDFATDKRSIRP